MLALRVPAHYSLPGMDANPLLRRFGERLRLARLDSGLSLAELARRAGLSRRYATETEAGRANPSLLKLAQLAGALGLPLRELCDLPTRSYRGERLALVGLRGAGKSTVGQLLAHALEAPFVELDRRVEEHAGMSLAELFDLHGAERFHQLEAAALEQVLGEADRLVLATGGSIVADRTTFARLRETCRTVWLRAEPEEHLARVLAQGDRRPMRDRPRAMEELRELLARRAPEYGRCELTVETTGRTVDEVVREVLAGVRANSR
jgi:XRE family transcriptional regulator, aerobic/anaerobic benzoate catabolism transcriptional regulator